MGSIFTCCGSAEPVDPKKPQDRFTISHTSQAVYWWDLLIIFVILASLIIVPLRIGFDLTDDTDWLGPDIAMDLLLVIDIVATFFKTFEAEGELIVTRDEIVWKYLKGRFALDVISTAPISYIALAAGSNHPAYRTNRMLRLGRLADFLLSWEKNSNLKPSVIGIIKCVFLVLYMSHFVGCVFHGLTLLVNSTLFTSTLNFSERTFWSRYFRSFYWALISLTGYNASTAVHWTEVALEGVVTIISIALFGAIIGIFGNLLTNLDSSKLYFRQKMDSVNDYMQYKKIKPALQDEVNGYYDYMWKSGKALEANDAIEALPANLKQKMSFQTCYTSIKKVPFFTDVANDMEFMGEVVKALRSRIGLPNSYIVKKGEMGAEMFFISRGELNVVANGFVVFTMTDGHFFGEIALIYKTKRTATIVARTFCDMYVLTKDEFAKVMRKYPNQSKGIKTVAKQRFEALQAKENDERQKKEEEERERAERERLQLAAEAAQAELEDVGDQAHSEPGDEFDDDRDELGLLEPPKDDEPARPQTSNGGPRGRQKPPHVESAAASPEARAGQSPDQPTQTSGSE